MPDEVDAAPETLAAEPARGRFPFWGWLMVVAVVAFAAGYLLTNVGGNEPKDPALSLAQDAGRAIPTEQYAAFADGVISDDEVVEAAEAFQKCGDDAGVEGLVVAVSDTGWEVSHSSGDDWVAVQECRIRYFDATYDVYALQTLPAVGTSE